jgi:hypothetical protein
MCARGFVFSLDAFVAFVLITITISLLIFTIGTPKSYHHELEAAHMLAYDTLQVLASSTDDPASGTYLEQVIASSDRGGVDAIMKKVAGGNRDYKGIVPPGYGYRLEYLDVDSVAPTDEDTWGVGWVPIYDAGTDGCDYGSDRCGKSFTKLQASATTFLSLYDIQPNPGESPFCHANCRGYESPGKYASPCNVTPCDTVNSNFLHGNNTVRIIRLVVYT